MLHNSCERGELEKCEKQPCRHQDQGKRSKTEIEAGKKGMEWGEDVLSFHLFLTILVCY